PARGRCCRGPGPAGRPPPGGPPGPPAPAGRPPRGKAGGRAGPGRPPRRRPLTAPRRGVLMSVRGTRIPPHLQLPIAGVTPPPTEKEGQRLFPTGNFRFYRPVYRDKTPP